MIKYQNTILMKGSKALELYQEWKKTGKPEDKKKLDLHMKEVDQRYQQLFK